MSSEVLRGRAGAGLTTGKASYIEQAVRNGRLFIEQPYELYTGENHDVWRRLYTRMEDRWQLHAPLVFLEGLTALRLDRDQIPKLEDVNRFMWPRTGFRAVAVSGYVPAASFFARISQREFPTTITIRDGAALDYLPEPDIFHDIAGHVPMHMDPAFADVLARLGRCAQTAERRAAEVRDPFDARQQLASMQKALARFFWFTIEFGLMLAPSGREWKAYGSGLLSSFGELQHAVLSSDVQRVPFVLEWVVNQPFTIDTYQPLLFIVQDFAHLRELVGELEERLEEGRLDDVNPGAPDVSEHG